MRVLVVHNFYQQPGGEDVVFRDECRMLRHHGHEVATFTQHNRQLAGASRLKTAAAAVWNRRVCRELADVVRAHRAEVVHFHNTFPSISPGSYYAAREAGAAVVQTLHNYRLLCPNALLLRDGSPCERCLGQVIAWPGVLHACYRSSRLTAGVSAAVVWAHRLLGTWRLAVDRYIAPSDLCRRKYLEGGLLPPERVTVKPHCLIQDPGPGTGSGGYALFVGRLSAEKGIAILLAAWTSHPIHLPLRIIGDGPLAPEVRQAAARCPQITWLGRQEAPQTMAAIGDARFLVAPSQCYETFGRVVIEAFAKGTPVLTSDIGAMAELVQHGETGLHFRSGDAADLACQVLGLQGNAARLRKMRGQARCEFERQYTAERNYIQLLRIYEDAIRLRGGVAAGERRGVREKAAIA